MKKASPLLSIVALFVVIIYLVTQRNHPPIEETPLAEPAPPREEPAEPLPAPLYTDGPKSRDGIGKFYQGREISFVMGHPAINWLERPERESEEAPDKVIHLIKLRPDEILADIGAGSGYYSLRLAKKFPKSQIIAIDIQEEMLAFLDEKISQSHTQNIRTHLGKIDGLNLPPATIDAALIVDAYHEFSHPYEMMKSLVNALRPGGRLFLLEYRAEDPTVPIKPLHKMTEAQAKKEMQFIGLEWVETLHDLPWQHFMIFRKPS